MAGILKACSNVPVITSCPPGTAKVLLFDVPNTPDGLGLMTMDAFMCCMINKFFGVGTITIKGSDLIEGLYYREGLIQSLLVYAWNIPNYLIREGQNGLPVEVGQWKYIFDDAGKVSGVNIYGISVGEDDLISIIPNPTCSSTPAGGFSDGINTRFFVPAGYNSYDFEWTDALRIKYGLIGSFKVWQKDVNGVWGPTAIEPTFVGNEPTIFTFPLNEQESLILVS